MHFTEENSKSQKKKVVVEDFQQIAILGKGSYGEVVLVKKKDQEETFAMKIIDKAFLFKEKKQYQIYIEREILMKLNSPLISKLHYSFQNKYKLFFVLEYLENGGFNDFLKIHKKLDLSVIQFYAAEIVQILEFLHSNGIAHRDLKPDNLMLTGSNHLKLIDFGTAYFFNSNFVNQDLLKTINQIKQLEKGENEEEIIDNYQSRHKPTFVGTAEYVSPELLNDEECSAPVDLWALGCIIFKMFMGRTPFLEQSEYMIFQNIKKCQYKIPEVVLIYCEYCCRSYQMMLKTQFHVYSVVTLNYVQVLELKVKSLSVLYNGQAVIKIMMHQRVILFSMELIEPHLENNKRLFQQGHLKNRNNQRDISLQLTLIHQKMKIIHHKKAFKKVQIYAFTIFKVAENLNLKETKKEILNGIVQKKCGWVSYKPRQLILFEPGRLNYFDPKTQMLKGEIVLKIIKLDPSLKAEITGKGKWQITTPTRHYYFKDIDNSIPGTVWVEKISLLMQQAFLKFQK